MSPQDLLDMVVIPLLQNGRATPEQQTAMARDLVALSIEHRRMRQTLDELAQESAEQEMLDQRQRDAEVLAIARRLGLRVAPVVVADPVRVVSFPARGRFAESAVS